MGPIFLHVNFIYIYIYIYPIIDFKKYCWDWIRVRLIEIEEILAFLDSVTFTMRV
jgi:hypothetical protein